jgi:hypothetical protein
MEGRSSTYQLAQIDPVKSDRYARQMAVRIDPAMINTLEKSYMDGPINQQALREIIHCDQENPFKSI